jgi:hypothetical protein
MPAASRLWRGFGSHHPGSDLEASRVPYDFAVPLGASPRETETYAHISVCSSFFPNSPNWKQRRCPSDSGDPFHAQRSVAMEAPGRLGDTCELRSRTQGASGSQKRTESKPHLPRGPLGPPPGKQEGQEGWAIALSGRSSWDPPRPATPRDVIGTCSQSRAPFAGLRPIRSSLVSA